MKFLGSSQQSAGSTSYLCSVGPRSEELVDVTLQDEIELVGDLVVAAAASADHMSEDDIDKILGVKFDGAADGPDPD